MPLLRRSPQGPLIDTGRTVHPSRPTSNTPPRAMAVEDMRSDHPNSEPARNWAACAGHPQGHRRPCP